MSALPEMIPIPMPGGFDVEMPRFLKVRQTFSDATVDDVEAAVAECFAALPSMDITGKSVAIGVGSRGISPQPRVLKAVVDQLLAAGAKPFVVPAMGSHAGGTCTFRYLQV